MTVPADETLAFRGAKSTQGYALGSECAEKAVRMGNTCSMNNSAAETESPPEAYPTKNKEKVPPREKENVTPAATPQPSQPVITPAPPSAKVHSNRPSNVPIINDPEIDPMYLQADPSRWTYEENVFHGSVTFRAIGKQEEIKGHSIQEGLEHFKEHPAKFIAFIYSTKLYYIYLLVLFDYIKIISFF